MTEPQTIRAPRLRLEPFSPSHLTERYVGWLNDPEVVRYSEHRRRRHTLDSCRAYRLSFAGTPHLFLAIVVERPELGHVGNVTAHVDEENGVADLGILIGERSAWGKGYGSEAWTALCDHLLRVVGLRKLTAGTIAPNVAMRRIAERVGMVPDGTRIAHRVWDGRPVDVLCYALFREDWLRRHPREPFAA